MSVNPAVSVVVVAHRESLFLPGCVASLLAQTVRELEALVVLNGEEGPHAEVGRALARGDERVRLLGCSPRPAGAARNVAVEVSRAPWLYFVDDDVEVPPDTLAKLLALGEQHPEAAIIGGPNLTPPGDPDFAQMAGELLASPLGSGPSRRRYRRAVARVASERDLILCNLAVRREVFARGVHFPEEFFGGEENVLMARAQEAREVLCYRAELFVFHHRRATWRGHLEQMVRYGGGRAVAILRSRRARHPAFFLPLALVAYLLAAPVAALGGVERWWLPAAVYGALVVVAALAIGWRRRRPAWFLYLLALFPLSHLAYAAGLFAVLRSRVPWRRSMW